MNITRRGKIARLPEEIRRQLNQRLRNGQPGLELLNWLNSLPEVQTVIAARFGGKPIRKQNLSDWRQGGYVVWLEQQEALELAAPVAAELQELAQTTGEPLKDQMATWLAARYLVAARKREAANGGDESSWVRLRQFCHDLTALRRGDYYSGRLQLEREKSDHARPDAQNLTLAFFMQESKNHPDVLESFRAAYKLFRERVVGTSPPPPSQG
jgi:hypothetical protein